MSTEMTEVSWAPVTEVRRFLGVLFAPPPRRAVTLAGVAAAGAAVLAATLLSLLRQTGVAATDSVWAEDGTIFLAQAVNGSFPAVLTTSYNGYYMVLQRLLVEPVTWFPAASAATLFAFEAALCNALFALVVYVASAAALRSRVLRAAAAAVAVLPPVGMVEILNNLSNVHWAGLYALFWVALWVPAGRAGRIVAIVVAAAAAFTNILVLIFVPLLLVRVAVRRDWLSAALLSIVCAGLTLDLVALATGASTRVGGIRFAPLPGLRSYVTRVIPSSVLGEGVVGPVMVRLTTGLILTGSALVAAVFAVGIYRRGQANWPVAVVAWAHSAALWVFAQGFGGMTPRYAACSTMLIIAGLAALVAPPLDAGPVAVSLSSRAQIARLAMIGFVVLVGASILVNFREPTVRGLGPSWSQAVAAAQRECGRQPPDAIVKLPIAPPGWTTSLPCSYLRR